jgi:hypothetical protein
MSKQELPTYAFPNPGSSDSPLYAQYGMELRDWFAGQALSASGDALQLLGGDSDVLVGVDPLTFPKLLAAMAYAFADAMLAERQRYAQAGVRAS